MMKDFDYNTDDEAFDDIDVADYESDPEVAEGKQDARKHKYHAVAGEERDVVRLDIDLVTDSTEEEQEAVERSTQRDIRAKQERKAALDNAMETWGNVLKLDTGMREASGYKVRRKEEKIATASKRAEQWYIQEAIEREVIKGDKPRLLKTLNQFFNDFSLVNDSQDNDFHRYAAGDRKGQPVFEGTMTLDRKQRKKSDCIATDDGVRRRTARGGRIITDLKAVDNARYCPGRGDLLFAERVVDAKRRVDEVSRAVGPLLPDFRRAVLENASLKEIGESLGYKHKQASAVGGAILRCALEAAADAYDRIAARAKSEAKGTAVRMPPVDWIIAEVLASPMIGANDNIPAGVGVLAA
ncbi:hypothetical protein [Bradyrhizobium guangdongense]